MRVLLLLASLFAAVYADGSSVTNEKPTSSTCTSIWHKCQDAVTSNGCKAIKHGSFYCCKWKKGPKTKTGKKAQRCKKRNGNDEPSLTWP